MKKIHYSSLFLISSRPIPSGTTPAFGLKGLIYFLVILMVLSIQLCAVSAQPITLQPLWSIGTGIRDYVTSGNTERGVAYNPISGHVLLVSRTSGFRVVILDSENGNELGFLTLTDTNGLPFITGGTFALSMIGVADDGVIYAGNLTTAGTTSPYKLYRWANESANPTLAYSGDPGAGTNARWGDTIDVRGAGTNTQVILGSGSGTGLDSSIVSIFSTTNGVDFTAIKLTTSGISAGDFRQGIAFGIGNTFYGKQSGVVNTRYLSFNLSTRTATLITNLPINTSIGPIGVDLKNNILAGVNFSTHQLLAYDIFDTAAPILVGTNSFPTPATANGNGVGSVDFGGGKVFAVDTQNGLVAAKINISTNLFPPAIVTQPLPQSVLEGATVTLSVSATGSRPISYQWRFEGTNVAGATNSTLTFTNAQVSATGSYSVEVNNLAGSAASSTVVLLVIRPLQTDAMTLLWRLGIGSRPYLANDNSHRGLAFNPRTTNVVLVSRTGGNKIYVLDGNTGADLRTLNTDSTIIFGGTFVLNMIGVADDGVVYAANLTTDSAATQFTIYRWENDSADAVPTIAFLGDPSFGDADINRRRFGDTFDVRGSGANTQILAASRNGRNVALFTTADGVNFTPTLINTPDAPAGSSGLGVAFGAGNSFWGKVSGGLLYNIGFDLTTGVGTILRTLGALDFPTAVTAIGFNAATNLLAGVTLETPDNLRLYDFSNPTNSPVILDQENFLSDNDNLNGTGSVDFGRDRVYALDSNNGILAMRVSLAPPAPPSISVSRSGNNVVLTFAGGTLQTATTVNGTFTDVSGVISPLTVDTSASPQKFWRVRK